ncbi:MAG: VOC family protein [Alphaproteobacteria bacterium]|nr:VOC family protein [Alphaproteobacteria bacterium]MCB9792421.1 VOC family protein [Alphaproteobacteria bacterium]
MQFDSVLFLCASGAARGPMAEALARRILGPELRVRAAALAPERPHPLTAAALAELELVAPVSAALDAVDLGDFDLVVGLGPDAPAGGAPRLSWAVPAPVEALERFRATRDQLAQRLEVLAALRDAPAPLAPVEFHASVRVPDIAQAARFYAWLLGVAPKEWTHRYVTFVSEALRTNFVILVDDGKPLHQDTLYHLGVELPDRAAVIDAHHRAAAAGWPIHKPARTTWRGTPLHELWLKDPGGNLIEVYARLTEAELAEMPADQEPRFLVPG